MESRLNFYDSSKVEKDFIRNDMVAQHVPYIFLTSKLLFTMEDHDANEQEKQGIEQYFRDTILSYNYSPKIWHGFYLENQIFSRTERSRA